MLNLTRGLVAEVISKGIEKLHICCKKRIYKDKIIAQIMAEYYFDIETYSRGKKINPDKDKIITIQFQKINIETGNPIDDLVILKEWESSEKQIVTEIFHKFFREELNEWAFVPVGYSLNFEWEFLISKFKKYLGKRLSRRYLHYRKPYLNVKPIIILLNKGRFRGATLNKCTGKSHSGTQVRQWYENKEFDKIDTYVRNEAEAFLEFLQRIMSNVEQLKEILCV